MLSSKLCGISDIVTLKYILSHNYPPKFVGMIMNYQKSPRFINIEKAKEELGWKPAISFKDGVEKTVKSLADMIGVKNEKTH